MPKLSSATAQKVEETEGAEFTPLPEDIYEAVLDGEVEVAEGDKGVYWKWTFKITTEGYEGRKQFLNTSLNENAMWRLKQVFEAFGVSADTDTDDLIGKPVKIHVVQRIIGAGSRKGETGNEIRSVLPLEQVTTTPGESSDAKSKAKKAKAKDDDLPLF